MEYKYFLLFQKSSPSRSKCKTIVEHVLSFLVMDENDSPGHSAKFCVHSLMEYL